MKASEINPTSWRFGASQIKTDMLMRRWASVISNVRHMEDTLLKLMQNPQTTTEQLYLGAKLYSDMTTQLHQMAESIDSYIYSNQRKPELSTPHMRSCYAMKTGREIDCNCADWGEN